MDFPWDKELSTVERIFPVMDPNCGNPEGDVWTISPDSSTPGWETDSGCPAYGLPREVAEAICAAWAASRRMNKEALRRLVEMAYLYAWGPEGDSDKRGEFRSLVKPSVQRIVGDFVWRGRDGFLWSDPTPLDRAGRRG